MTPTVTQQLHKFIDDVTMNQLRMIDEAVKILLLSNISPERMDLMYLTGSIDVSVRIDEQIVFTVFVLEKEPLVFSVFGKWVGPWDHLNA